jgi:antitoxin ParD1/3/4/toxin ParE1/3/4
MSAYALHPEAFIDLDDIREHIAEDNPDAADRVTTEVFDGIRALVAFPCQGYRRPNLTSRPQRFKLVREYVIAYAPRKKRCGLWPYFTGGAAPV